LPALESRALFITRDLILRARIHVIAAGPPRGFAVARPRSPFVQRRSRFLLRGPRAAALEPEHCHVRLRLLELRQGGQQFFAGFAAERRGY